MSMSNFPNTVPPNFITNMGLSLKGAVVTQKTVNDGAGSIVTKASAIYTYENADCTVTITAESK